MLVLISGSNRPGCRTLVVSRIVEKLLREAGAEVHLVDLLGLPPFGPDSYKTKPPELAAHQEAIFECEGIVTCVPEYNGSFPGALKYFIDLLEFPGSLVGKPCAFVGLAAGMWGAMRAVEQLEMVYQYRCAHLFGHRVFIPKIYEVLDEPNLTTRSDDVNERLARLATGFVEMTRRLDAGGRITEPC
jgi:chromate reductase, NAD(P)H dehydrogenase (quinone)